ncbi:uncharacterized protein G2W53_037334 [Senna tora]|uniref:Uncharacterized protein n=1 Tax=Senna tora TaxID=362788 RepID=A0A834W9J2_9FABA|nr:uncharacterized protein G2W53_037334 [Senna tora]
MKQRRSKGVEAQADDNDLSDYNYYSTSDLPCKKHPSSSSVASLLLFLLRDLLQSQFLHRGSRKRRPRLLPHREREEQNPNSQFEAEITGQRRGVSDSEAEQQQQRGNQEEQWRILEDREIVQEEEGEGEGPVI